MDLAVLAEAAGRGRIEWHKHSLERMLERGISRASVIEVLSKGGIIEDYPHDKPYPSVLMLGWIENSPLHVVAAYDNKSGYCFIVTAYKPDMEHFGPDFRTRRRHV